ncbi:MAG: hypothetical protein LBT21_01545, partial [Oscillospiraceae bacterium]|nr:hypothetical protein [Oscillospiraceae bacterium]
MRIKVRALLSRLMLILLLPAVIFTAASVPKTAFAASVTITATLTDGAVQKGSKKTFDVIARDGGNKIPSSVTLNGADVPKNRDDTDKTSYTLIFTQLGTNIVVVSAGGTSKTYRLNYQKAEKGDVIGQAVWCAELFTIGCGYLAEPERVDIIEGETAAITLLRFLHAHGYTAF